MSGEAVALVLAVVLVFVALAKAVLRWRARTIGSEVRRTPNPYEGAFNGGPRALRVPGDRTVAGTGFCPYGEDLGPGHGCLKSFGHDGAHMIYRREMDHG